MWYTVHYTSARRFGFPFAVPLIVVLENMQSKACLKLHEREQTTASNEVRMANKQPNLLMFVGHAPGMQALHADDVLMTCICTSVTKGRSY